MQVRTVEAWTICDGITAAASPTGCKVSCTVVSCERDCSDSAAHTCTGCRMFSMFSMCVLNLFLLKSSSKSAYSSRIPCCPVQGRMTLLSLSACICSISEQITMRWETYKQTIKQAPVTILATTYNVIHATKHVARSSTVWFVDTNTHTHRERER